MKVMLGNHLEEYLHQHHYNTISLELTTDNTQHVGEQFIVRPRMPEPRVIFSKPVTEDGYTKYLVDDITVYVAKDIKAENDEIEIMDQIVDGIDTCHVRGWIGNRR
ncbi:MAG: hypothetical protein JEZ08_05850 [Clostridiales bacterium]|nr:hypothetical protein [Clostridiales bacterium]